tara:strand:- start:74 stop:811 length:738 start_codon:yes stop_codon:yes gene_type:complete
MVTFNNTPIAIAYKDGYAGTFLLKLIEFSKNIIPYPKSDMEISHTGEVMDGYNTWLNLQKYNGTNIHDIITDDLHQIEKNNKSFVFRTDSITALKLSKQITNLKIILVKHFPIDYYFENLMFKKIYEEKYEYHKNKEGNINVETFWTKLLINKVYETPVHTKENYLGDVYELNMMDLFQYFDKFYDICEFLNIEPNDKTIEFYQSYMANQPTPESIFIEDLLKNKDLEKNIFNNAMISGYKKIKK